jgi:cytochrome c-type biogenesis protein CcmH
MRLYGLLAVLILCGFTAVAATDNRQSRQFNSVQQEQQYQSLIRQLRCPKCQNTDIADSNAIIAADMRDKVFQLMQQGRTKQQIIDYMVARYGHFVTYDPPLNPLTLLLWLGPLLVIALGALVIIRLGKSGKSGLLALSDAERRRLQSLLDQAEGKKP